MDSWIAQMCRGRARRQTLAWAVVFLAGIAFVFSNARYVRNFFEGPFALQPNELAQVTDLEATPDYFVSVTGEKVIDTEIQEVTTTTRNGVKEGSHVSAGYYAFLVGDRFLVVKSAKQPPNKVSGELLPMPANLSSELFSGADGQKIRNHFYPFYLEPEGFRYPGYWGIGIAWLFIGLFWKYGKPAWIHWRDVSKHPLVKRLEQWGDTAGVSVDVERELNNSVVYKSSGIIVTNKYVVRKRFFSFNILRFDDLLWAYKKVTQRSVNFIPTGKTFEGILIFYGGSETFSGNEQKVNEVLSFASNKAPWAVIGYSEDIKNLFNKQTTDFCQVVESRRQELSKRA